MHPYFAALIGGSLIGLAGVMLLVTEGRIMGISGILGGIISHRTAAEFNWRLAFLAGLIVGAVPFALSGQFFDFEIGTPTGWLIVAGLLVGYGTRLGSGCTSGHGICGLGRLSKRSLVAVIVFIGFGMGTTSLLRSLFGIWG